MKWLMGIVVVCLVVLSTTALAIADEGTDETTSAVNTERNAVSWDKLGECLPTSVEGMEAGDLEGGTMQIPDMQNPGQRLSYSHALRHFSNDDGGISVTIMDTDYNGILLAPFMAPYEYDGSDGAIKSLEIAGNPAKMMLQKDDGKITEVTCMVLVGGCILVTVQGQEGVSQEKVLVVTESVNYGTLTELAGK